MNHGTVTGGVVKAAVSAYTPGSYGVASVRRVVFMIATTDSHHQKAFWNCEAEGDPVTLDLIEAQAQPGRGIKVDYELATRPYIKRGVHAGEIRFLRVIKAEFDTRGRKTEDGEQEPVPANAGEGDSP